MLDLLGMLVSGVLSGGATGLIGVGIQRWFDYKNRQQDIEIVKLNLANTVELSKLESDRARIQADISLTESNNNLEMSLALADSEALQASIAADSTQYLDKAAQRKRGWVANLVTLMMATVDFTRGMLRPGMTIYLCILVTAMFTWAQELAAAHGVNITASQVSDLINQIIATVLYVFTTITLWWFGSRPAKTKYDK